MDEGRLQAAVQSALEQKSLGVLVLRGGKIVAEGYASGWGPEKARSIASATKLIDATALPRCRHDRQPIDLDGQ